MAVRMLIHKARRRQAERDLDAALRTFEPRVARAFRAAVAAVRSAASLRAISMAIEAGDLERAVNLVGAVELANRLRGEGLEPGERSAVDEIVAVMQAGAAAGMRQMPREMGLRATLDLTNPEAVRYLQTHIPTLIREVNRETMEAARDAVLRGMTEGRPAPKIAREVRDSIGLTRSQALAVSNFRRQLETGEMGSGKAPWDRRLSAAERAQARSIFSAGGASGPQVDALAERYYESLVNRRAKNIARTEVHRAFAEGQEELWRQAVQQGLLIPELTRRVWIVTPDDRLRPSHAAIPGMNPGGVPLGQPFDTPFGPVMSPGDPHPELINCRCTVALEIDE